MRGEDSVDRNEGMRDGKTLGSVSLQIHPTCQSPVCPEQKKIFSRIHSGGKLFANLLDSNT